MYLCTTLAAILLLGGNSLSDVMSDISSVSYVMTQLRKSENEKNMMKIQYEEKLAQQQQKIRETEIERDRVLASLGKTQCYLGKNPRVICYRQFSEFFISLLYIASVQC